MRRGLCALLIVVGTAIAGPATAHAQSPPPYIPWTDILPPLPTDPVDVQPGPVEHCKKPTMKCVDGAARRLQKIRDKFGCDHRAVFADTYLLLTKELRRTMKRDPEFFDDNPYLITQIVEFSNYFLRMHAADARGEKIPEAWRIANDAAKSGDANAAQDMLLGINAHVQRDMPYVVAALGVRMPDGKSRKPDHERGNKVLAAAYETIVRDIERRYDPIIKLTNLSWSPIDDIAGLEAVKGWREGIWRNAERLLNAKTEAQREQVSQSIELNAATWARMIATPQVPPGYRATRDEYCAKQAAARR